MPLKHIVLLSLRPSLPSADLARLKSSLSDLQTVIPQILSFSWISNNSPENLHQGYLHGFIMEFKDYLDRTTYLEHPAHLKIAQEMIFPALMKGTNSLIVFDYFVDEPEA